MITVFFDLDGVLSNFVKGALLIHGREDVKHCDVGWGIEKQLGIEPSAFWAPLGFGFWSALEPYEDGMKLFRMTEELVGSDHIGIVTSPCDTLGCTDGNRAWVAKHLPACYRRQLFIGSAKHLFAGPDKILVDDHDANVVKWQESGGRFLLPPRPWNGLGAIANRDGSFNVEPAFAHLRVQVIQARRESDE